MVFYNLPGVRVVGKYFFQQGVWFFWQQVTVEYNKPRAMVIEEIIFFGLLGNPFSG
jgi:hypothetical protein